MHTLTCSDTQNTGYVVVISTYSTRQKKFTVDYIKTHQTCLNGAISVVVNENGDASFDRLISQITTTDLPSTADFTIQTLGTTPATRILKFTSDDVIEL